MLRLMRRYCNTVDHGTIIIPGVEDGPMQKAASDIVKQAVIVLRQQLKGHRVTIEVFLRWLRTVEIEYRDWFFQHNGESREDIYNVALTVVARRLRTAIRLEVNKAGSNRVMAELPWQAAIPLQLERNAVQGPHWGFVLGRLMDNNKPYWEQRDQFRDHLRAAGLQDVNDQFGRWNAHPLEEEARTLGEATEALLAPLLPKIEQLEEGDPYEDDRRLGLVEEDTDDEDEAQKAR